MTEQDGAARWNFKAAVWSALIGSAGLVVVAWIGAAVGRNQGDDKRIDLQKEIRARDAQIALLQEEVERLKGGHRGPAPSHGDNSGDDNADSEIVKALFALAPFATATKENVRFDLYGCAASGGVTVCALKLTAAVKDTDIMLAVKQTGGIRRTNVEFTVAVDREGNDFVASSVRIGSKSNPSNGQLRTRLVADLATPAVFQFDGGQPRGAEWSVLEIWGSVTHPFNIPFRDVPRQSFVPPPP